MVVDNTQIRQDQQIAEALEQQQTRLRRFIRSRVADTEDVDDILQDVFYELVAAYRLMTPIREIGSWLLRVARNRITDRFRKQQPALLNDSAPLTAEGETLSLEDLLPSRELGPDAAYARTVLLDALENALDELPDAQRTVFIATEIDGISFKQLAADTGLSINTLLSRKRYAVLHLRRKLESNYRNLKTGSNL